MDANQAIRSRRSIRSFTEETISPETIESLLRAAMAAPSAGNAQPWRFVVTEDRSLLEKVSTTHPYAAMAKEAPLAIIVCADPSAERYPGFWVQDCSAAVENLLLAAHASGLGAVWCGVHPNEAVVVGIRDLFAIPQDIVPLALLVIGHPKETKPPAERFEPGWVHRDRWTG